MGKVEEALEKAQKEIAENLYSDKKQTVISNEKTVFQVQETENKPSLSPRISYRQSKVARIKNDLLKKNRLISYFDGNIVSDQYKIIKAKILQNTGKEGLNTILVTSAFRGEGKSLTTANLAISLAKEATHTVLLVDTDLRKPSLHQLFGLRPNQGLSDYLLYDVPLTDLFINPGINRLLFMPGRHSIENSVEVVGAPKMERLVEELKTRYPERYVIFDSPPLIESADSLILSRYVDGVILVIEAGKTQTEHIEKALSLLEDSNIIGLVLNKGEIPESKKYYYHKLKP